MSYIDDERFLALRSKILHVVKILNGYIAYLAKAKKNQNKTE